MANEFIARNGLVSNDNTIINGNLNANGNITIEKDSCPSLILQDNSTLSNTESPRILFKDNDQNYHWIDATNNGLRISSGINIGDNHTIFKTNGEIESTNKLSILSGGISVAGVNRTGNIFTDTTGGTVLAGVNTGDQDLSDLATYGYVGNTFLKLAGGTMTGAVYVNNSTNSTSTTTGAIRTAGGLGVVGNIYAGGTVTAPTFSGAFSGNATTATKLATVRTLWGQNFDGSGNVSGNLTGVGTISANGKLTVSAGGISVAGVNRTGNIFTDVTGGTVLSGVNTGDQDLSGLATYNYVNSTFSPTGHNHDNKYLQLTGGTLSGQLTVNNSIQATNIKLSNLTNGYIPYHISNTYGLSDSSIYIDNSNIGIGTTDLLSPLHVNKYFSGTTENWILTLQNNNIVDAQKPTVGILFDAGNINSAKSGIVYQRTGPYGTGNLYFLNDSGANTNKPTISGSTKLAILSNGNVLIGTNIDYGYKLYVDGNAYFNNGIIVKNVNKSVPYFTDVTGGTVLSGVNTGDQDLSGLATYNYVNSNFSPATHTHIPEYDLRYVNVTGDTMTGSLTATSFVKQGGTASQFLKADGSVDSNSYSLSSHLHDDRYYTESESDSRFVNVTGDTMSGKLTVSAGGISVAGVNKTGNIFTDTTGGTVLSGVNTGDQDLSELATYDYVDSTFSPTTHTHIPEYDLRYVNVTGDTMTGSLTATSFVKQGGTASQFLKANGSVDSNTYSLSSHLHDDRYYTESESDSRFVNVAGDTMSGKLTISSGGISVAGVNRTGNIFTDTTGGTVLAGVNTGDQDLSGLATYDYVDNTFSPTTHTHIPEYDLRYVNVTGDTMTGSLTAASFVKQGGTASQFLKANGSIDSNSYSLSSHLHDDRYYTESESDSRFVNVTGDTMSGKLTISSGGISVAGVNKTGNIFTDVTGGTVLAGVNTGDQDLSNLSTYTYVDNTFLKKSGGTMTGNLTVPNYFRSDGATIWHSGNDGVGSGLDADLLDGKDSTFFRKRYDATIQIGTWSKILYATPIALSGSFMISIQHTRGSVVVGNVFLVTFGHSGHGQITALGTHGYTQIAVRLTGDENNIYFEVKDNGSGVTGTTQITQITLDNINANITTYTDFNDGTTLIGSVKSEVSTENNRINVDGNVVAYLTDNVSSATKLQTARTIWGQNFDGSGNVSGALTGVSTISASGKLTISSGGISVAGVNRTGNIFTDVTGGTVLAGVNTGDQDLSGLATYTYVDNTFLKLAGGTMTGTVYVNNSTNSTSTTTGAIRTAGGLGVVGNGYFGGTVTASAFSGNSSSATRLATTRTIWGQSFDGTANVSGSLTGVSTISASGKLTISSGGISVAGVNRTGNIFTDTTGGTVLSGVNTGDQDLSGLATYNYVNSTFSNINHKHYNLYTPDGTSEVVYSDNGGSFHVKGNLYVSGSTYSTNSETLNINSNYIYLRYGAVSGLANDAYTGIESIKYDGVNNGRLVFDNTGTARVGDVGDEQPLVTRDESNNMSPNGYVYWDSVNGKLKTGTLTTTNINSNYYTQTISDSRFVNMTGDTMTGKLTISSGGISVAGVNRTGNIFTDVTGGTVLAGVNTGDQDLSNLSTYTYVDNTFLKKSGGTMTGVLNFKNGTWNNVGDDVAIGDINVQGQLGIKALNTANPGIAFYNNSAVAVGNLISNAGTLQWSGNTVWHSGNDGVESGLDADLLDGTHLKSIIGFNTKRDFINGTLITTDIDYSGTEGSPFYLEIKGNAYTRGYPCLTQAQGYIYNNTIIHYSVTHLGYVGIFGLLALNVNGRLCFWFPRQAYWEGYSIFVSDAYNTSYNRVIAIDDIAKPAGTKEVIISEHTVTSAFLDSNVASATKLSTSRTIWGQTDTDGTGNVSGAMTGVSTITASGNITTSGIVYTNGKANTGDQDLSNLSTYTYVDNTFLKLAGGTMTNSIFLPLNLPALRFGNARAWDSAIGHDSASYEVEAFMTQNIGSKYRFKVGFDPVNFANGTFVNMTNADLEIGAGYCKINNNTVWHSGNDGDGSGLDADLLDGLQKTSFAQEYNYSTTSQNTGWYKIKILSTSNWMLYFTIRVYQNYEYYDIVVSGYQYGNNYWDSPNAKLITGSPNSVDVKFGHDSVNNLWVAIPAGSYTGLKICNITNGHVQVSDWSTKFSITNETTLTGTVDSTITAKRPLVYDENAASATKLQTTRTIWGQNFDGTGNVSGAMTGVDTISASGTITAPTFSGALSGNASTATQLQNTRTIWGQNFDGTGNVSGALTGVSTITTTGNITTSGIVYTNGKANTGDQDLSNLSTYTYVDNTFLKKSGGTMTGNLTAPNYLRSDGATIWHSGNDGAGSGLDADLLDGLDSTFFRKRYDATIQTGKWSRILYATPIELSGSFMISIQYTRGNVVVCNVFLVTFGHSEHGQITALGTHGYTQIAVRLTGDENNIYFEVKDSYGTIGTSQITRITLDNINASITTYTDFNDGTTLIGSVKSEVSTENNRINVDGNTVAYLTDNVESANKLKTARSIWGQSFDGSGNVSGALTGVSTISASGKLTISAGGISVAGVNRTGNIFTDVTGGTVLAGVNTGDQDLSGLATYTYVDTTFVPKTRTISAGSGLSGGGSLSGNITLSHADTSSAISLTTTNTGFNVIQNATIALDTYGHVTSTSSSSINLDDYFVKITGDTMTGSLYVNNSTNSTNTSTGAIKTSGGLGVVGNIYAGGTIGSTGPIKSSSFDAFKLIGGSYGVIHRKDTNNYYILLTNSGDTEGSYNSLRPLYINLETGNVSMGHNATISGYVSGGRFYAGYDSGYSSSMSCSNWFRSNGNSGWLNATYNTGILSDTSNVVRTYLTNKFRVYNTESDSIRTEGGLLAGGGISVAGVNRTGNIFTDTTGGTVLAGVNTGDQDLSNLSTYTYVDTTFLKKSGGTLTGELIVNNVLSVLSGTITNKTSGTHVLYSLPTSKGRCMIIEYTIYNNGNTSSRSGNVTCNFNTTGITYKEDATPDLGTSTSDVKFAPIISGSNVLFQSIITGSDTWNFKLSIRYF